MLIFTEHIPVLSHISLSIAYSKSFADKSTDGCAILNDGDACVTQYSYPFYGTIYNPLSLPSGGKFRPNLPLHHLATLKSSSPLPLFPNNPNPQLTPFPL